MTRGVALWALVLLMVTPLARAQAPSPADPPYTDWNPSFIGFASTVRPDPEADCADGSRACIDRTLAEMYRRFHTVVPVCDHNALFSLAYTRVTEDVRNAVDEGFFPDPEWLQRWDAPFARLYFTSYSHFLAGRRELLPQVWRIAYDAGRDRRVSGFGNFLLSMNGHIQRDMPFSLYHAGLVGRDGVSRKPEFDRENERLKALYRPVLTEFAHRFDETIDDVDVLPGIAADDDAALQLLHQWREVAWRNAERLVAARSDAERREVARDIERYAETWAQLIYAGSSYKGGANSAARDARCARYGGQDPSFRNVGGIARAIVGRRGLRVTRHGRAAKRGTVGLRLRCPDTGGHCEGTLSLERGRASLGRSVFSVRAGREEPARVRLTRAARSLLARRSKLPVAIVVRARPAPGHAAPPPRRRPATLRG
jgi:uncharacterized protein DUF5995